MQKHAAKFGAHQDVCCYDKIHFHSQYVNIFMSVYTSKQSS